MKKVSLLIITAIVLSNACVERAKPIQKSDRSKIKKFIHAAPPAIANKIEASFGDGSITMLGYEVSPMEVAPGGKVTVKWYWRLEKQIDAGWRLFTHVVDSTGTSRINADGTGPVRKNYQPGSWKVGEIIEDVQKITIPKNWKWPIAEFRTGIWRGKDRMKLRGRSDGSNRIRGVMVKIKGARASDVPELMIPKATGRIKIDGKTDEDAWSRAALVKSFFRPTSGNPVTKTPTEARLLWDDENLYASFLCKDQRIRSTYTKHDDELWNQDVVEIFLDPDGDSKNYYEFQASPAGMTFDSFLPSYRKNQNDWESQMKAAVTVDGTLNKPEDDDVSWTAEIAIPFKAIKHALKAPPAEGDVWRANMFRIDIGKQGISGMAWSPPLKPDYHVLDRFGKFRFVKLIEEAAAPPAAAPAAKAPAAAPAAEAPAAAPPDKAEGKE